MKNEEVKIKVLVYVPGWGDGEGIDGISSYIMNIYKNINRDRIEFTIISFYSNRSVFENELLNLRGKIIKYPIDNIKRIKKKIVICKTIIKELNKNEYNAVYIQSSVPYDHLYMYFIKKYSNVPIRIIHSHNSNFNKQFGNSIRMILGYFSKLFENSSTNYLACSKKAAYWLFRKSKVENGEVELINNGIDINKFKYDIEIRKIFRKKLGISEKVVIGNVGRFTFQKNHNFLLDVFNEYLKINSEAILLLVGEGELEEEIRNKMKELNIDNKVIFYGISNEVENLMQVMDCFVMTSFYEGLPIVGVEAQASGLPLIVSDKITNEMKIINNVKFISLEDNASIWAGEIDKIIKLQRKDTSNELIEKGFDIESIARELEKLFMANNKLLK
jgi:glycosyltransferase involved in cell wall biosynthesis